MNVPGEMGDSNSRRHQRGCWTRFKKVIGSPLGGPLRLYIRPVTANKRDRRIAREKRETHNSTSPSRANKVDEMRTSAGAAISGGSRRDEGEREREFIKAKMAAF